MSFCSFISGSRLAPYPIDVTTEFNPKTVWFIEKCRELEDEKQQLIYQKIELERQLQQRAKDHKRLRQELEETKDLVRDVR